MNFPKAKQGLIYVTYNCNHKIWQSKFTHLERPCPNCTKKIHQERARRKKELPFYLRTDT